jgi:exosome complex component RRP4
VFQTLETRLLFDIVYVMIFSSETGNSFLFLPILIRRLKSHFCSLPSGVDLIMGLNGYIWISKHVRDNEKEGQEGFDAEAVYSNQNDVCF